MTNRRTTERSSSRPDDQQVGYGKPPKGSQFKKGQSGNPKGRVPGARSFRADLDAELRAEVQVTENGKAVLLTKQRLMVKALMAKAIKGEPRAISLTVELLSRMFGLDDQDGTRAAPVSPTDQTILRDFLQRHGSTSPIARDE